MGRPTLGTQLMTAWSLDIEDINFELSSEPLGVLHARYHPRWRRGLAPNMAVFLGKMARAVSEYRPVNLRHLHGTEVLFALGSRNQEAATEPIYRALPEAAVLSLHRDVVGPRFPDAAAYLASLPFLPRALEWRRRSVGYRRLGYDLSFHTYWLTYGYYLMALRVLREIEPRLVMLANDHSMWMRAIARAARDCGIDTGYVQHASVSSGFPPLGFRLAFLDGIDAAEKYDQPTLGRHQAFLTGIAKVDEERVRARERTSSSRVGICVNAADPVEGVVAFVHELKRIAPELDLILRPHPSDRRPWHTLVTGIGRSDARTETSFRFLDRVDAIVTGASNIALEAALVKVVPLCYDFAGTGGDHYGFVLRGVCVKVSSAEHAVKVLGGSPLRISTEALQAYSATAGTSYDGRSAELIRRLIQDHLAGGIDLTQWRRIDRIRHFEAYELRA